MKTGLIFKRRKIFMAGGVLAAVGLAQPFAKFAKSIIKKDISEMPAEYSMLKNISQRRNILKVKQLEIRSAVFNERIDNLVCENTTFSDCDFESDSVLHIKQLTNVKFERCYFKDSQISSGIWKDVHFVDCTGQGKFMILADKGSEDILFEKCEFSGPPAKSGAAHENDFATVGSLGTAFFNNCKLTFLRITGESSLTLEKSHLRKIDASTMRQGGNLCLKNVEVEEYIDFQMEIFSKFVVSNSSFAYLNLEKITSKSVLVEHCIGHAVGKFMKLGEMTIRNSTFQDDGEKRDPFMNKRAALSVNASTIKNLTLDGVKFRGSNGNLYLGGNENILFDKNDPASEKFETSDFDTITIKNTPQKNAFCGYIKANQLSIENSNIQNSYFGQCTLKKITFSNVELHDRLDFTNTRVQEYVKDNVRASPNATIISDVKKLIN